MKEREDQLVLIAYEHFGTEAFTTTDIRRVLPIDAKYHASEDLNFASKRTNVQIIRVSRGLYRVVGEYEDLAALKSEQPTNTRAGTHVRQFGSMRSHVEGDILTVRGHFAGHTLLIDEKERLWTASLRPLS